MKSLIPGFWYLEKKNNKEDLKKKEILPTKIYSYKNNIDNWISVDKLYKRILIELTNNLNRIHKLKWKTSSWEVIIGPWLKKYLVVISNRVLLVKTNYNSKKKFLFNHSNNMNLNCYDINDFIYKAINNSWNEEIFKRLEKFFYLKRKNISQIDNIEDVKTNPKKKKIRLKSYIIYFILKIYNSIFTRKSDFVISKPYFGKKILFFKFLLSLKEIPIIYNMDNEKMNLKFNKILRKNFKFQKSLNLNEKISKLLMPECLPKIYLEGFDKVKKKIEISNLPSQKKVIFTSNLRSDSIFKFWLA